MKKLVLLIAMLVIPFTSYSIDLKKYQIKSGIIEQKIEGTVTGTQTTYFDDYGIKEATYTKNTMKILGISKSTETLTISDKDWTIDINLDEKTGTRVSNKVIKDMLDGIAEKDYERFGEEMLKKLGGKKVGNEVILGKNCEVWEIKKVNTTSWIYKGIALKSVVSMMGMTTNYTATSFQENVPIPAEKFQVPKGIKITDEEINKEDMPVNLEDMFKMLQEIEFEEDD